MRKYKKFFALTLVLASGLLIVAATVRAQSGITGRELIPLENGYVAALIQGDADRLFSFWHQDVIIWPGPEYMPLERSFAEQFVRQSIAERSGAWSTPMMEPYSFLMIDDSAVVHYRLDFTETDARGEKQQRRFRFSHFWVQTDAGWKLLGASSAEESI